jgi:hypothetical protein
MERVATEKMLELGTFADADAPEGYDASPPLWYVQAISGLAAWLAALMATLWIIVIFGSWTSAATPVGLALLVGAASLLRLKDFRGSVFFEQFAIAVGLCGQALLAIGLVRMHFSTTAMCLVFALINIALCVLIPNPKQTFISTLIASATLAIAFDPEGDHSTFVFGINLLSAAVAFALLALHVNLRWGYGDKKRVAVTYGLVLSLFGYVALSLQPFRHTLGVDLMVATAAILLALCLLVFFVGRELGEGSSYGRQAVLVAAIVVLAYLTRQSTGIMASVLVLALGCYRRDNIVMGLGIAFLPFFLGAFYYNLDTSLLVKAGAAAGAGVFLLALRLALKKLGGRLVPVEAADEN